MPVGLVRGCRAPAASTGCGSGSSSIDIDMILRISQTKNHKDMHDTGK